ncbi:MAG TPA: hypothetical protein VGX03_00435 [Candidatus Binatia bacterium]|jgi:hypothetical protein|nr:hypothetical protein [Candidatus Binatia bacterium]
MSMTELRREIEFGLENLEKIYVSICRFAQQEIDAEVKTSALTYECLGYYNAIEHLIIRILKFRRMAISAGPFSHRDTLKTFETLVNEGNITADEEILKVIENLMAFRHVATKIYGFLIDATKLRFVIRDIEENHSRMRQLILNVVDAIKER